MEIDMEEIEPASQEAIASAERLCNAIHLRFPVAVNMFRTRWNAWHEACFTNGTPERLEDCTSTADFEALRRLGPKIIPFIVLKLARDPEKNSHGVLLYTALESDPAYSIKPGQSLTSSNALQRYASRIVELNRKRNKIVDELTAEFIQHHQENSIHSNSLAYTNCDPYWDLLEMGPSIIAHLMVAYFDFRRGFWFQLLHEIIHGHKLGAYMFQKSVMFEQCRVFMNEGEYDQVPEYITNEWDIYFRTGKEGPLVREYHSKYRR